MIEIKDLTIRYSTADEKSSWDAVKGASARFCDNEFVMIYGPSGAGKTSLLHAICGLETPLSGEVVLNGTSTKEFTERDWDAFRSKNIGFLFKDFKLIEHQSALDNVAMALSFSKTSREEAKKKAMSALEFVGLEDKASVLPENLTSEEKQLVAIARVVIKDPDIILADEPTGAFDSEVSAKVMQALKNASKESLIIMATHNRDLAEKYAGSLYILEDGILSKKETGQLNNNVVADITNTEKLPHTSMGFLHAIALSFSNMKNHKLRSSLIVLGSTIGVIAIAFILSIQTGLNRYIQQTEETTLSSTPITIIKYKLNTSSSNSTDDAAKIQSSDTSNKESKRAQYLKDAINNRRIALNNTVGTLLSSNGNSNTDSTALINDVPALKQYLDTNPNNINDSVASIEYTYDTSPVIYLEKNDSYEEVYPGGITSAVGAGRTGSRGSRASVTSASTLLSMMSDFRPLPEDSSTYEDSASLVEGKWASNSSEAVLVLNSDGTMDDTLAYALGLKDFASELEPLIEKYKNGEAVEYPGIYDSYAYSDMIGKTFKVIDPSQVFKKNESGTWDDMSSDDSYMKSIISSGKELKIVGVIKPAENTKAEAVLSNGIYYHSNLDKECRDAAANSAIVQDQMANPNTDVLSGKSFEWLKLASTVTDRVDFSNLVNINGDTLASCITIHPEVLDFTSKEEKITSEVQLSDEEQARMVLELLSDRDFQQFIDDLSNSQSFDNSLHTVLAGAGSAYASYYATEVLAGRTPQSATDYFGPNGEGYDWSLYARDALPESLEEDVSNFVGKYAGKVSDYLMQSIETEVAAVLNDLQTELMSEDNDKELIEFDEAKFAAAFSVTITEDDLSQLGAYISGSSSRTYVNNLADFGYASTDNPITCTIYPKTFADKTKITDVLDTYNTNKKLDDKESEVVVYSDTTGTLVNIAQAAINVISGVLIGFIIIQMISVLILIAIICGISTLQRTREIGILRALGACRSDIWMVFNSETFLIGILASTVGVAIAWILGLIVNSAMHNANANFDIAQLTPELAIGLILVSVVISTLAGVIPSLLASRKDPVKIIREG